MRFQWLFWLSAIAIGASLPWVAQDFGAENPEESAPQRTLAERTGDYFREKWISVTGEPVEAGGFGGGGSARSDEVASRVKLPLETELAEKGMEFGAPVFIRLFKESREFEVWVQDSDSVEFELFKTYRICRYSGKLGPKLKEGDHQAPEGFYHVSRSRMNPNSDYHLSFDLGFPNQYDRHHNRTGSYLMVHGDCVSIGCYAMTDESIEEIYTLADAALANGQKFFRVHTFPFRMTDERMDELEEEEKWFEFWANLKEGYDYFENLKRPPNVTVTDGKYHFDD